jgi:hypothetical protein
MELPAKPTGTCSAYNRFSTFGTTTVPSGSRTTKNICLIAPLTVSEKQISQNGAGVVRNSWRSSAPDLYVIECGHEVGNDLSRFLFRYGIERILLTRLENVFERAAILGRASIPIKLHGERWGRQQERD